MDVAIGAQPPVRRWKWSQVRVGFFHLPAALLSCTLLCGCPTTATREVEAIVLAVNHGDLTAASPVLQHVRTLKKNATVAAGETVHSGVETEADLLLLPGALAELGPDSQLEIKELRLGKNGFALTEDMHRSMQLRFIEGTLLVSVSFEADDRARWSLETPHGRITSRLGGLCWVEASPGRTRLLSLRGDFTFVPNGGTPSAVLRSGYAQAWPSPTAAPFPAELDRETSPLYTHGIKVERKLLNLQRAVAFKPYPWRQ